MNNLINENLVVMDMEAKNKKEVLEKVSSLIHAEKKLNCKMHLMGLKECQGCEQCAKVGYLQSLIAREEMFPTSVGFLFGIPHGKSSSVKNATLAFIRLKNPVIWDEEEAEEAKFIFAIAVTEEEGKNEHIEILTKLSRSILDDEFRAKLENAETKKEILDVLSFEK
jgi:mannitol/fructose-specific phosphotransferase system IIA component (Ntr-type)